MIMLYILNPACINLTSDVLIFYISYNLHFSLNLQLLIWLKVKWFSTFHHSFGIETQLLLTIQLVISYLHFNFKIYFHINFTTKLAFYIHSFLFRPWHKSWISTLISMITWERILYEPNYYSVWVNWLFCTPSMICVFNQKVATALSASNTKF